MESTCSLVAAGHFLDEYIVGMVGATEAAASCGYDSGCVAGARMPGIFDGA